MPNTERPRLRERISGTWFDLIHRHNLVYNTCWEDPRLDLKALELTPDDSVLVITSAGCNALDYALENPRQIFAVDINPLQNALFDLKRVAIRRLDYHTFFELFGKGRLANWNEVYRDALRPELSPASQACWDKRGSFFTARPGERTFYFRGSAGLFAWIINRYIDRVAQVRPAIDSLLLATSIEEQQEIFERHRLASVLWSPFLKWLLQRDTTLAMLGVPRAQRRHLDAAYPGGLGQFAIDRVTDVLTKKPLEDNYFWRVYLTGSYSPNCCPRYLSRDGFARLQRGLVDRVELDTVSILEFLRRHPGTISRFVLLDHMDWLANHRPDVLAAEWEEILAHASPGARVLWRSASFGAEFVHDLPSGSSGGKVGDRLQYHWEWASRLHALDRVHTYGSFWIADILS